MTSAGISLTAAAVLATTLAASAIDLKPKMFPLTVLGVKVGVPVTISFDANTVGDALALQVRASELERGPGESA